MRKQRGWDARRVQEKSRSRTPEACRQNLGGVQVRAGAGRTGVHKAGLNRRQGDRAAATRGATPRTARTADGLPGRREVCIPKSQEK